MWNSLTGWFFTDASKSSGMPGSAVSVKFDFVMVLELLNGIPYSTAEAEASRW